MHTDPSCDRPVHTAPDRARPARTAYKRTRRAENALIAALCIVACLSVGTVGAVLHRERKSAASMAALRSTVRSENAEIVTIDLLRTPVPTAVVAQMQPVQATPAPSASPAPRASPERLATLAAENGAFFGWLTIPGTQTDDPVMFTPSDEQYYLRRDWYGKSSKSGLLFLAGGSDPSYAGNLIVYGHNMKSGARFGELDRFLDETFFASHRTLTFDTPTRGGAYRVVAVYQATLDPNAAFKFYHYARIDSAAMFDMYAAETLSRSYLDAGEALSCGDELLTLVTCADHAPNERLIVVAKRVSD